MEYFLPKSQIVTTNKKIFHFKNETLVEVKTGASELKTWISFFRGASQRSFFPSDILPSSAARGVGGGWRQGVSAEAPKQDNGCVIILKSNLKGSLRSNYNYYRKENFEFRLGKMQRCPLALPFQEVRSLSHSAQSIPNCLARE